MAATTASGKDPTAGVFSNTIFGAPPVPPSEPLPRVPGDPDAWFATPPPTLFFVPDPPISMVHRPPGAPEPTAEWDGSAAIERGDLYHLKYGWSADAFCQKGRLMLGAAAQGPPGSGHGGSIAAILDDIIGVAGMCCTLQLHLAGTLQAQEEFKDVPADTHTYIADALDKYHRLPAAEKAAFRFHPSVTLADLEARRDKLLPYSPAEIAFIFSALSRTIREMPDIPGSASPPTGLVSEISCRLRRRVPLLTRLVTRGRMTKLEGKRIHITAEIWGKRTTRTTALEGDESGGWEGEWDVLLAEGKGVLVAMYGVDLKKGSKPKM